MTTIKKKFANLLILNAVPWLVALVATHGQLTMLIVINLVLINIGFTLANVFSR